MPRVLTALNAQITTASVAIKSLTIEGKQVTLAVFRQLIEENIFDWNKPPALQGVGWGHVRYLIDRDPSEAINLIWQKGTELRRCIVTRHAPGIIQLANTYRSSHDELFSRWDGPNLIRYYRTYEPNYIEWIDGTYPNIDELDVRKVCGPQPTYNGRGVYAEFQSEEKQWQDRCIEAIRDYRARCRIATDEARQEIEADRQSYASIVAPLFDLPQLFIAV